MLASILAVTLGLTFAQASTVDFNDLSLSDRQEVTVQLIDGYGDRYGLSKYQKRQMYETIDCESNFNAKIRSHYPGEQSYGLVQINLPAHPDVSKREAQDPDFAVDFMAKNFAAGNARIWTCWRNLYGS